MEYVAQGLKFQKPAGKDEQHAQKLLKEIEESAPDPGLWYKTRKDIITDFFQTFLKQTHDPSKYQKTVDLFLNHLSQHHPQLSIMPDLTPKIVVSFLHALGQSDPQAANAHLQLLSGCFDYAIKTEVLNDNPTQHIRPLE